ncbi:MAG TPA: DUF1801 domain-containing protein [Acidimicrobiia bacterium]
MSDRAAVDKYIEKAPQPHRSTLSEIRETLRELLPDATETISYGMPAFKVGSKPVAGYAYYKNHCSYFPHSSGVLTRLVNEIEGYEWSKGTLKFPPDSPPPRELLARLVAVRLDEID